MSWLTRKPAVVEDLHLSTDSMMEWMKSVGDPTLCLVSGHWCYFKAKKGPVEIKIESDRRFDGESVRDQVESCYKNVRRAMEELGRK